ncbi:MAG: tyrosine-type recombinase/integrase [Nitrobacter sp.]
MAHGDRPKIVLATEDSFAALIRQFRVSPKFLDYSPSTQDIWGRELDHMSYPDTLGAVSINELRPSIVQAYFDGLAGRTGKQNSALSVMKQLEKWAIVRDLLPRQITIGVEIEHSEDGHIPWTDEQVALGEKECRADLAKAITLASNTGQRGSDLVRMGPTDLETYQGIDGINVKQMKTGKVMWIPITSPLALAMKDWPRRPGPFLTQRNGRAWTRKQLTKAWMFYRDTNAAMEPLRLCGPDKDTPLVLHGLRGTACVRLRRAGATAEQIADMVGMSVEMVERYCRFSVQRENAVAAIHHLERNISERKGDKFRKGTN